MKSKIKSRKLSFTLLLDFLAFSAVVLVFLYSFQILFLNAYYKINRTKSLKNTLESAEKVVATKNYSDRLDKLSMEEEVCIQVADETGEFTYYSPFFRHCAGKDNVELTKIKKEFVNGNEKFLELEFMNERLHNKLLVFGKKVNNKHYVFVNASLEPMDRSAEILKSQFKHVAIIVLLLSFVLSYYFSRKISAPILKINTEAKKLGFKSSEADFRINTDVLELQELSKTLTEAQKELSKTDELKREFLANVSHDLKTPLTMIEAYASSARDLNYNNKKKRERDLNIIIDEAERLNMLVNDILLLSKIENKSNDLSIEKINITDLVNVILERFAIYENEGYSFEFKETKDYFIKADKKSIERVIYNLINNAISYTGDDKKVKIEFEIIKGNIKIKVIDTGKGIKDSDKKLVWNKYFRINKRHRREVVGTGLGLSIVREILEEHKFEYGIDSELDKGSCFWFECKLYK